MEHRRCDALIFSPHNKHAHMDEREKERTPVHTYRSPPIHDGDDSTNYKVNCRLYTIITAQVSLPFARRPVMCHSRTPK